MPSAPCHARMAALQNHRGQPLTDADGQVLKVGSTVVDSYYVRRGHCSRHCPSREGRRRERADRLARTKSRPSSMTPWLAAVCTCAGRSMAGSLAGLLTLSPTPRPACSESSTTALFGPTAARGQQSSVLRTMAMGQMLATTHGQSYLAQSLWCERAADLSADYPLPLVASAMPCTVLCLCKGGRVEALCQV